METTTTRARPCWFRVLAAVVAVVFVAACGSGNGDADESASSGIDRTDQPDQNQDESGADVDRAGIVTLGYDLVGQAQGSLTWDPTEAGTASASGLYYYVYGSLLRKTREGELLPDLAAGSEVVGTNTIELTLREGLEFSDGTAFDAEVVKAGLERNLAATDSPAFGAEFFSLEGIDVTSPTTLTLTIPDGTAASWHDTYLAAVETMIVHPDADFDAPVGAGPMTIGNYVPEERLDLRRNDRYWDAESILPAGFDIVHAPDGQSASNALAAGQIDVATVEIANIPAIESSSEVLFEPDPNALMTLQLCKRDGPLADPDVRLALNKAIDRQLLSDVVFAGEYTAALGLWPEGHRFHDATVDDSVQYDPDGARELLAGAGYDQGVEFDLHVLGQGGMPEVATVLQQQLADVGVTANIVPAPDYVASFLSAQSAGAGAIPTMSSDRGKLRQWTGEALGNTCGYDDPELQSLADDLATVTDSSDAAVEAWHGIEQLVVADDALSVFLLFGGSVVSYSGDRLGGVATMPYIVPVLDPRKVYVKAG